MSLTLISFALNGSIAVTVFAFALHADKFEDVRFVLGQPRLLVLSLLAMFVLTPFLGLAIAVTLDIPTAAQVALVALALSPIPPLLPQQELGAGGHASYGIGLVIIVAVLSPVLVPALVELLGRIMGRPYGVGPGQVAAVVAGLVVVPLLAGIAFRWRWPRAADAIREPATRVAGIVLSIATIALLIAVLPAVWDFIGAWTVVAMVLFNVGALGLGHLVAGPDRDRAVVLALSCASRHPGIALTIAAANYPGRNFSAAVILCLLVNGIVCPLYLKWQRSTTTEVAA